MPKRTFTEVEPSSPTLPPSSPSKKIHTSTPASRSTASSLFSTPYTPSVYSIPADSPTNPLGLKRRVNNLTLPKSTPFSKHIALRFQLITGSETTPPPKPSLWVTSSSSSTFPSDNAVHSKNPKATQYASEGTYRIVQAPLSYTFRHLRALILFSSLATLSRGPVYQATSLPYIMAYRLVRKARSRTEGCASNYPARVTRITPPAPSPILSPPQTRKDKGTKTSRMKRRMRAGGGRVKMILPSDMFGTCARATQNVGSSITTMTRRPSISH
ncbi:hypothetical protein BJV77DRAFT_696441 [Russula vinacea]|nr:hypothetical protein BJV77DRAFT_696441 [Russula vinacea]